MTVRDLLRGLPVFDRPLPAFDTESVPGEPSALFLSWLHEAIDAGVSEPHAMTLSTVDADGRPDARVLILKDVDADGWQFATAATSAKGAQLAASTHAALSFHWREQGRQVRVRGAVTAAERLRSILVIRRIGRAERLPETLDVIEVLGGPEDRDCGSSGSIEPSRARSSGARGEGRRRDREDASPHRTSFEGLASCMGKQSSSQPRTTESLWIRTAFC